MTNTLTQVSDQDTSSVYDARYFESDIFNITERTEQGNYVRVSWKEIKSLLVSVNKIPRWQLEIKAHKKVRQGCIRVINQNDKATAFPMDYDNLTSISYARLLRTLQSSDFPYQYILHTTSTSKPDAPKVHLFLMLAVPCDVEDIKTSYKTNAEYLVSRHGFPVGWDAKTESAARNFIVPFKHNHHVDVYSRLTGQKWELLRDKQASTDTVLSNVPVVADTGKTSAVSDTAQHPGSMSWLRNYIADHVFSKYNKQAVNWVLDTFSLDTLTHGSSSFVKQQAKRRVVLKFDCPVCKRKGKDAKLKAYASFNVVNGDLLMECRREHCSFGGTWKTKSHDEMLSGSLPVYSLVTARAVAASLTRRAVVFSVESSSSIYMYFGEGACYPRPTVEQALLEVLEDDYGYQHGRDSLFTTDNGVVQLDCGYSGFRNMKRADIHGSIIKTWVDYSDRKLISHENLHIIGLVKHEHEKYYPSPYLIREFGRQQFKAPSITVNGMKLGTKHLESHSSLAGDLFRDACYFALSPKQIQNVLSSLSPIVFIHPGKRDGVRDIKMFRQRILFALSRGCHVLVCAGSTTSEVQKLATKYKLDRRCRIGLEKLHTVCPTFDVLAEVGRLFCEKKNLPFRNIEREKVGGL